MAISESAERKSGININLLDKLRWSGKHPSAGKDAHVKLEKQMEANREAVLRGKTDYTFTPYDNKTKDMIPHWLAQERARTYDPTNYLIKRDRIEGAVLLVNGGVMWFVGGVLSLDAIVRTASISGGQHLAENSLVVACCLATTFVGAKLMKLSGEPIERVLEYYRKQVDEKEKIQKAPGLIKLENLEQNKKKSIPSS